MKQVPLIPIVALLAVASAGAHEKSPIEKACSEREVKVRLLADKGDGAPEREAARRRAGRSLDDAVADSMLRGRAEVSRDAEGSSLGWRRSAGAEGAADCRRRLTALEKRFPGRVSFMDPAKGGMAEVARRAVQPVPEELRKTPADPGLAGRFFDSGRERKPGAAAAAGAVSGASLPRRAPDSRPRSSMPPSYNRSFGEPPAPGPIAEALGAYSGDGSHTRTAGMTIDTDGDLSNAVPHLASMARRDPYRQGQTSVRYRNGRSLDPTRVPYVVIPIGYTAARNGEFVVVQYGGRSALAIVGDRGPRHRFGEGSMALAVALGINPSGTSGGVSSGVRYTFLGQGAGNPSSEAEVLGALKQRSLALQESGLLASR